MQSVEIVPASPQRLSSVLRPDRGELFLAAADNAREVLKGRVVWNVSSTAGGGGVAEMLHGFLRYVVGSGIDTRWMVMEGSPEFFAVTKRIHNQLHGDPGDGVILDDQHRHIYEGLLATVANELGPLLHPRDIVLLHDPQTVGLAPLFLASGAALIWRCHVGTEHSNTWTEQAWAFLHPYVMAAHGDVFSRQAYVPGWLPADRVAIIAPSIDPLSTKNQALANDAVLAILGRVGLLAFDADRASFPNGYDQPHEVTDRVVVVREGGALDPNVPVVIQVSRWDRLKDMPGVLRGFVEGDVGTATGAHLLLVGPDVAGVHDDPEGLSVLTECTDLWRRLSPAQRSTVSLATAPMADLEQNAAIINALQRHARVVVQKSLKEGFGLTVAEGMWKGAPIVASAVGGIQDQVRDGVDGVLLADPTDLATFAGAIKQLLTDPIRSRRLGQAGHERVRDHFLADRDLTDWLALIEFLTSA